MQATTTEGPTAHLFPQTWKWTCVIRLASQPSMLTMF